MKRSLIKLLSFLKDGQGISLGADAFLCGQDLDGSDKIEGFIKEGEEIKVISRECAGGYPLSDMTKDDLKYIFESDIPTKLENKLYQITEANEV